MINVPPPTMMATINVQPTHIETTLLNFLNTTSDGQGLERTTVTHRFQYPHDPAAVTLAITQAVIKALGQLEANHLPQPTHRL